MTRCLSPCGRSFLQAGDRRTRQQRLGLSSSEKTRHFQPPNSQHFPSLLSLRGLGSDLEGQASARVWAPMPLEGPRGWLPISIRVQRRKGRMRTAPVSLFCNVNSNNPFSKHRTIRGSGLALVSDRVHLFTGLHLGQQQGPGRVAGETADRGGRRSLSNR